ncbi:Retrovirus-related Pol polyprotein from transposon [Ceratobasidium sp. AG-Ba]|nr:Retrovirus-related Pol polyprotein from transposon [Ceratobasidium sp. AG-Ba]
MRLPLPLFQARFLPQFHLRDPKSQPLLIPTVALEPSGVPFPSPLPDPPPNPFLSPSTPTPTARVRCLATHSDPPRPSAALVERLAHTYATFTPANPLPVANPIPPQTTPQLPQTTPVPLQTTQLPLQASAMSKDLRAARSSLSSLPKFSDDMDPMREAEWRHNFVVATRGVTDEERAQLWADWLVFEGVAYDWYEALQAAGPTELADSKDWTKLLPRIEARWPTPACDPFVLAEQKRHCWDNSILRVEEMLPALTDDTNPVKPHEVWAKQHLSRGKDRNSSNADLVHDTIKRALPAFIIPLLPKRARYGDQFETLCKDIGELSSSKIVSAYGVDQAVSSLQTLSIDPSPERQTPRQPSRASSLFPSSLRRTPSYSSTMPQTPIAAPTFGAGQTTNRPNQVAFAPLPPETPARGQQTRHIPPHMPSGQPVNAAATAPTTGPRTPAQRPLRDPAPDLVAENTAGERERYNRLVNKFNEKYGELATPNMSKPYPLSPGTFKQTHDVCIKCGRDFHTAIQCKNPNAWLPESERTMWGVILGSLIRASKAGSMPDTPTPAPRAVRNTAQLEEEEEEQVAQYQSENEEGFEHTINDVDSYSSPPEIVDLYEIFEKTTRYKDNPFRVWAQVAHEDETGPKLDARVTVDGGAMLCVMDRTYWGRVEAQFGELAKSPIVCRMADGSCTRSIGRGNALVGVASQWHPIQFEVLDSRGNYDLLLGKPWLRTAGAAQVFAGDTLLIAGPNGPIELKNEHPLPPLPALIQSGVEVLPPVTQHQQTPEPESEPEPTPEPEPAPEPEPERDNEQEGQADEKTSESVPLRRSRRLQKKPAVEMDETDNPFWLDGAMVERLEQWIGMSTECEVEDAREPEYVLEESVAVQKIKTETEDEFLQRMWKLAHQEREEMTQREILLTELVEQDAKVYRLQEVLERAMRALQRAKGPADICTLETDLNDRHHTAQRQLPTPPTAESTRLEDPFEPNRVAKILRKVTIGDDLTPEQRKQVSELVSEYADIFARSLSEVLPINFMQMKLDIPAGTQFPCRAGQKRLTEPQRQWLYKTLDDMEDAKIIAKVSQDQVEAVSPTNIVPKPGGSELPSLATLRRMANEQCQLYGLPLMWPDVDVEGPEELPKPVETKYRLVHNFAAVNKVTQLRPFPMGDLPNMQRKVAGHRWVSVMDFMAGFNAIPVAPESVPYTGFHVDGRGYYVYLRMPFGLTGAPTTFCEMVAAAFHDLIGNVLEVWMDDVATACNDFNACLTNMRLIFAKCRAHGLSLSPAKTVLFMTEARFAGARCSSDGVRPDLAKVKAILEWPEPKTALEVLSFLGCVGSYRSKIRNYARIAQPLSDLTRDVRPPQIGTASGRHDYKKALKDTVINLDKEGCKAFAMLKTILTSDTVTRAPIYDGRPFIVTTDGSKYGFGAVLSQEFDVTDGSGVTRKVTYPVAFASKRTSRTEERYIPFLLEFAVLKFALDEFDNLIFGQAIELETDCKALADLLGHDKLNSTHERWHKSIIARNIVAVRHKPGVENRVCDALSRMYESRPDDNTAPGRDETVDPGWEAAKQIINDVSHLIEDTDTALLLKRFAGDAFFADILLHLVFDLAEDSTTVSSDEERARKKRAHRAEDYLVEDGKLWLVRGKGVKEGAKVECIPSSEAKELALAVHSAGGHFGRDMTILTLQLRFFWPELRRDVIEAVTTCPRCKNFGPRLLSAHMQPITRARPFDLLVGDYVSLPAGHGGFKTVLVLVDVYSRFLFTFPLKGPGTGKFTVDGLTKISDILLAPCTFMADGGSHFDCEEVREWAAARGVQPLKTPPYAPWANGLAEGSIKLLIGRLKTLCTATVGESPEEDADPTTTPAAWPKHLSTATAQLND